MANVFALYGYRLTLLNISRFLHNCRFINNKLQLRDKQSILPGSSSFYLLFLGMFAEIRLVFYQYFTIESRPSFMMFPNR